MNGLIKSDQKLGRSHRATAAWLQKETAKGHEANNLLCWLKVKLRRLPGSKSEGWARQMLLRARLVSFFAGLGVAGGFATFQLRQDVWESHRLLSEQVGHPSHEAYRGKPELLHFNAVCCPRYGFSSVDAL